MKFRSEDSPVINPRVRAVFHFCLLAEVDDVVATTCFLLSDSGSYLSGVVVPIDGGLIVH